MSNEFLVKGATLSLSATPPVTIVTTTHSLSSAVTGPFATAASSELLLEADIEAGFASYVTNYVNAPYVGGSLMFSALKSVSNLSELTTKSGEPVATKATTGTITCSPMVPGTDPSSGSPDPTPSFDLDFKVADAGQTLAKTD